MSAQLSLCPSYPAARSNYEIIAISGTAFTRATTLQASNLEDWTGVDQHHDYDEAARIARQHCLMFNVECWVVDRTDDGYIAFRVHPCEYTALVRSLPSANQSALN